MSSSSEIEVYKDHVVVFGQIIKRPQRVVPSDWMQYWEKAQKGERVS